MLKITMFSKADSVKGQGVGSAYLELIKMLKTQFPDELEIKINDYAKSDISHYHTINPNYYLSTFFKKKRGVKVGYVHFLPETLEGSIQLFSPFQKIFNWYLLSFYRKMDELVVVNPSFIPKLVALGCSEERVTYIPNFVSTDLFYEQSLSERESFREKLKIAQDRFVVLGVGQIQKRKGIDDFIQLAIDNPEIQFIWAGGFSFGKLTDGFEEYQEVYQNPPENLLFTGIIERNELVRYYNSADLFLLPSYNELFPMSILEAFSCSTPVMVRDLDLYASVIKDYCISCGDVKKMQEEIRVLAKNREYLIQWRACSIKASEYYSEANISKIWYRYYHHLAKKYHPVK